MACSQSRGAADLQLAGIFADDMVLQQGQSVPVWGWAAPGERVTVELAGQTRTTTADANGNWLVRLDAMTASSVPQELVVRSPSASLKRSRVLVGEVWLCSGQSNMALTLQEAGHAAEEQVSPPNSQLRVFVFRRQYAEAPAKEVRDGRWFSIAPANVGAVSATAYYFGKRLQQDLQVPIGLIESAWGGTPIEAWMSREMLAEHPDTGALAEERLAENKAGLQQNQKHLGAGGDPGKLPWPEWRTAQTPAWLFNGMVHPLIPFGIRGVIWYQGEQNVSNPLPYGKMFLTMIRGWRAAWGQGDFPFYYCQLPGLQLPATQAGNLARLRAMQAQALQLPNTGMAVLYDTAEELDNHPKNKQPAGQRLALLALAQTYGRALESSGPVFAGMTVESNSVRVRFGHLGGGLVAREVPATYRPVSTRAQSKPAVRTSPGSQLEGFALCGADARWHWAEARLDGSTVVVSSAQVPQPVGVRYAWADFGFFNLFNAAGLPARPFCSIEANAESMMPPGNSSDNPQSLNCGSAAAFHPGDRVCFLGDSITKAGLYPSYLELFYATRFPGRSPGFYNCGVGGDRASEMLKAAAFRVNTDVLGRKPTTVVLMVGMNDVERKNYVPGLAGAEVERKRKESLALYDASVPAIIRLLQQGGAQVTLMTPSIYDETARLSDPQRVASVGVNGALSCCAQKVRGWAKQYGAGLVDSYAVMDTINRRGQAQDPAFSLLGAGKDWNDRVHPGPVGAFVMAYAFLRAQGVEPWVARLDVDAAQGTIGSSSRNCRLENLSRSQGGVAFDSLESALPMVLPKNARAALQLVPFTDELNQEILCIAGLKDGLYRLSIDAQSAGDYTAQGLRAGINLAENSSSPQYRQAEAAAVISEKLRQAGEQCREVATLRYELAKQGKDPMDAAVYETRIKELWQKEKSRSGKVPSWLQTQYREAVEPGQLEKERQALVEQLHNACKPQWHHFSIQRQKDL